MFQKFSSPGTALIHGFLSMIFVAILVVAIAAAAGYAFADEVTATPPSTTVSIPIGQYISWGIDFLLAGLGAVVVWLCRMIPGQIGALLLTARADQALTKAIEFGLNAVKDATKDRALSVDIGNQVALAAYRYFEEHGNALVVQFAGTKEQIIEKIWARLRLEPQSSTTVDKIDQLAQKV